MFRDIVKECLSDVQYVAHDMLVNIEQSRCHTVPYDPI